MRHFFARRMFILVAASSLLALGGRVPAASVQKPPDHTVTIDDFRFDPGVLTVNVGDFITWSNKDAYTHRVVSKTAGFDSHDLDPEKSWKYTAAKAGEFTYQCMIHETMTGTLVVK